MASGSIPVDLFNPGQVFACLGLLEVAHIVLGGAEGGFEWADTAGTFHIGSVGGSHPVHTAVGFVVAADVRWISPRDDLRERDGGETETRTGIADSADPKSPDLPAVLRGTFDDVRRDVPIGYWADGSSRFSTTFKKSTNGASSHIRVRNALHAIRAMNIDLVAEDPFNQSARTESLFRLDPRGTVDPIHGGFSPDMLRKGNLDIRVATYPVCELFAVIGLQHGRPERLDSQHFAYHAWGQSVPLPPPLARAAIGAGLGLSETRRFVVEHVEVKKGGDRKMTFVEEEFGR